ncbi:MAG TPA: hypothetical protein VEF06_14555 [Bryobacteraceae bacterium]|nr:hypothetical protein [Bryobacteraceae bacterium]
MPVTLVSPMNDAQARAETAAARLDTLAGKTIALLDISKPGGSWLLDRLEHVLREKFGVARVVREAKPTYTKPAPAALLEKLRGADAVIEALAD